MPRVTINRINARIKYLDYEIVRGREYFYFSSLSLNAVQIQAAKKQTTLMVDSILALLVMRLTLLVL